MECSEELVRASSARCRSIWSCSSLIEGNRSLTVCEKIRGHCGVALGTPSAATCGSSVPAFFHDPLSRGARDAGRREHGLAVGRVPQHHRLLTRAARKRGRRAPQSWPPCTGRASGQCNIEGMNKILIAFSATALAAQTVHVKSGDLEGAASADGKIRAFKGIPFAAAAVGNLR